jgi:hypothetical protein
VHGAKLLKNVENIKGIGNLLFISIYIALKPLILKND